MTIQVQICSELFANPHRNGSNAGFDITIGLQMVTVEVTFSITRARLFVSYNFAAISRRFRGMTGNKIDAGAHRTV